MNKSYEEEVLSQARLYIAGKKTMRQIAGECCISKSAISYRFSAILPQIDAELYKQCREVIEYNLKIRHIRGGKATKQRWELKRGVC
jgi:putative DeoR family transcriptional regulator (stage III sporulation protein D)